MSVRGKVKYLGRGRNWAMTAKGRSGEYSVVFLTFENFHAGPAPRSTASMGLEKANHAPASIQRGDESQKKPDPNGAGSLFWGRRSGQLARLTTRARCGGAGSTHIQWMTLVLELGAHRTTPLQQPRSSYDCQDEVAIPPDPASFFPAQLPNLCTLFCRSSFFAYSAALARVNSSQSPPPSRNPARVTFPVFEYQPTFVFVLPLQSSSCLLRVAILGLLSYELPPFPTAPPPLSNHLNRSTFSFRLLIFVLASTYSSPQPSTLFSSFPVFDGSCYCPSPCFSFASYALTSLLAKAKQFFERSEPRHTLDGTRTRTTVSAHPLRPALPPLPTPTPTTVARCLSPSPSLPLDDYIALIGYTRSYDWPS
ncbi:uncharacterized protein CLUP02_16447 [Colletotrichum lupini]|uniref:Uncharacterized protein n=1 Tax=Colletotrichum lupini TaxID=145971 RepID=A0A9Q8T8G1_9PEZI|nr:uncharacterized protein CLUP02_16447 [Colletotrichum lupini]UQC90915.1 hypothetical protein CLUP02_16447 [Colletotrichum lupini]